MANKIFTLFTLLLLFIPAANAQQANAICSSLDDLMLEFGDSEITCREFNVIEKNENIHRYYSFTENYQAVLDTLYIDIHADTLSNTFTVQLNNIPYYGVDDYRGVVYIDNLKAYKVSIASKCVYFLTFLFSTTTGYGTSFTQYMVFNPNDHTYQVIESRYGTPLCFNDFDGDGTLDFLELQNTPNDVLYFDYADALVMPIQAYSATAQGLFVPKQIFLNNYYVIQCSKKKDKHWYACYHLIDKKKFWEQYKLLLLLPQNTTKEEEYFIEAMKTFLDSLE